MPKLRMLRGPEPDKVYDLTGEIVTLGRGRRNDIIIHDNEVSREHCRLARVLDDYEIHDGGSTNGTYVDGHKVDTSGWMLYNNCIIEIGDSITFQYTADSSPLDTGNMDQEVIADLNTKPFLVVKRASHDEIAVYPLEQETVELGRDLTNDIILQEAEVSRHHIRLERTSSGYTIEDLGSMNGTAVNGIFVKEPTLLRADDIITIGTTVEMIYFNEQSSDYTYYRDTFLPHLEDEEHSTQSRRPAGFDELLESERRKRTTQVEHGLKPQELENHIFLAYAREDWERVVSRLFIFLEDNDISVWADQYLSPDSDEWLDAIEQAVTECAAIVVVISNKAVRTGYVKRALRHFVNREKPIILLEYEPVERLPISIQNLPRVRYLPDAAHQSFQKILRELQRVL